MSRGSYLDPATDIPDNNHVNSKILLVYEEYSEMMSTQAILQKVGFDVLGISTEYTLSENVLSFNPDVVVAFGRAGKVTTIGVGRRLREMTRWQGKVVLILHPGYKPNPQDFAKIRADMLLEAPVQPLRMMQILGKMLGYDEALLQERLAKHGTDLYQGDGAIGVANSQGDQKDDLVIVTGRTEPEKTMSFDSTPDMESEKHQFDFGITPEGDSKPERKSGQDLEALWNELTDDKGGGFDTASEFVSGPEQEQEQEVVGKKKISEKVSFDLDRSESFSEQEIEKVAKELQSARNTEAARVAKYAKFTDKITDFDPRQGHSKIASRKIQIDIAKDWNHSEIESQDKLRQNFTKALFRKK